MMHNFSVPPFDDPQIEQGRMELEAAASVDYGELPERRTTFDTPPATPILTWQGQVVAASGSLVIIGGQAKTGKTTALIGITKAFLAGGGPVLGMPELVVNVPPSGSCAWYDTEMPLDLFDRNMKWACGTETAPDNFHVFPLRTLGQKDARENIFNSILSLRPTLVVVDGLADLVEGGVNDEKGSTNVIRELMALAEITGCCIFCVLHDNQGTTGNSQQKSRGHLGSELERKCDGSIVCERKEDAIVLRVRQIRRGNIPQDLAIRFNSENRPYGDGVYEEKAVNLKVVKAAKKLIEAFGGQTVSHKTLLDAIMQEEKIKDGAAKNRIRSLVSEGFIIQEVKNGKVSGYIVPAE